MAKRRKGKVTPKKVQRRMILDKWGTGKRFRIDYEDKKKFKKKEGEK